MSRDFQHFFIYKKSPAGPIWTGKNGFAKCDRVVNDYTDTISAWTTTMLTPYQRSHRLRGHGVLFLFCLFDLLKRSTVIKSLLLIFLKDQPWSNHSRQTFIKIDRDQIAVIDLLKRLTVSKSLSSIFEQDQTDRISLKIERFAKKNVFLGLWSFDL